MPQSNSPDIHPVLYLGSSLEHSALVDLPEFARFEERHRVELNPVLEPTGPWTQTVARHPKAAVALEILRGWPGRHQFKAAWKLVAEGRRVYFHWPLEGAVEVIDRGRFFSHFRIYLLAVLWRLLRLPLGRAASVGPALIPSAAPHDLVDETARMACDLLADPQRLPAPCPDPSGRIAGQGVYLRTDFWASLDTGGSYGHTCYVAKELATAADGLIAFVPNRYGLMDEFGINQVVIDHPARDHSEDSLLSASPVTVRLLRAAVQALRPAYIYERLCLGNLAGAWLSRELGIPYIVEYNGSELSMARTFGGTQWQRADLFERVEEAAFAQASLISVISREVGDGLVQRGVDPEKILVNPNGADPDEYAPWEDDQARDIARKDLGFDAGQTVVGFIGTFGGWHGVETLARAIPEVCARNPEISWLLIGTGSLRHLVDEMVEANGLQERVVLTGKVPHRRGAQLLKLCDILVSPHDSHMLDGKFFGSPTKLFEYMGVGGAIVASDLEQIGQVLRPSLLTSDLTAEPVLVNDERAVLVKPGSVPQLVAAVTLLAQQPATRRALGQNARRALVDHYSWSRHVHRLWEAATVGVRPEVPEAVPTALTTLATGDAYKDEVQDQWNNNPCGSQYVKDADEHTVEWFVEAEAYRYDVYAPWMPETMEFAAWAGKDVLEIGGGMGTDLAQFAQHGARVTDYDLSAGHLALAKENFALRGLKGQFHHGDGEALPFPNNSFDLVYSNGVIHHTPFTQRVVNEMLRVLRPGGKAIVMVYAEPSLHYWRQLVANLGLYRGQLIDWSIGEIMSRSVELTANDARPLVKVYTRARLRDIFAGFERITIVQRQLMREELPARLRWLPLSLAGRLMGWNLIVKAHKPSAAESG